jgi:hypothetical protein
MQNSNKFSQNNLTHYYLLQNSDNIYMCVSDVVGYLLVCELAPMTLEEGWSMVSIAIVS